MNAILKIEDWSDHHNNIVLDYLRIFLGLVIIFRSFSFAAHEDLIHSLILRDGIQYLTFMGIQYLILAGIGGGLLIAFGLLTRTGVLLNIPVLFTEIFFVSMPGRLMPVDRELIFSVIIFLLLLFFLIYGSGEFSSDHFIKVHRDVW